MSSLEQSFQTQPFKYVYYSPDNPQEQTNQESCHLTTVLQSVLLGALLRKYKKEKFSSVISCDQFLMCATRERL